MDEETTVSPINFSKTNKAMNDCLDEAARLLNEGTAETKLAAAATLAGIGKVFSDAAEGIADQVLCELAIAALGSDG